jgi:glycosyltransferase involved in cell wall biosynthesis
VEHEVAVAPVVAPTSAWVTRPGVTVCIPTHPARLRGPQLLARALASVVTQTLQPVAILIVNDQERQGAGATRRRLLQLVDTEWVAWLDSDDEWLPEHLEKLHRVAVETDSVYVFSWFHGRDPLGHFGRPFNPCTPHHTTMNILVRTDLAREVGFRDNEKGRFANEDWAFITGIAKLACERGLKMTHLAERTWTYHQQGQNSSGQPGQGDAL